MKWNGEAGEGSEAPIVSIWRGRAGWVLLMLALALPALAQSAQQRVFHDANGWVQESSGPLPSEKKLVVSRFVGAVRVVAGAPSAGYVLRLRSDAPQEKDARKQFADFHFDAARRGDTDVIQTVGPIDLAVRCELTLQLPAGADSVHVDTLAGKITIQGDVDHLDLQTHGGDIELDSAQLLRAVTMGGSVIVKHRVGDSLIRSGGGDIRIDASVGDLEITSLGGNIWLKAIARAEVQSGGGNIEVVHCLGSLAVHSAGGNITLGEMDGDVVAVTGGGNIYVGVAHGTVVASTALGNIDLWKLYQGADAQTGMGHIKAEFVGDRNSAKNSKLMTSMGDIEAYFAGSAPGNLYAVTGSCPAHRVISDFPELKLTSGAPQYGPHSASLEGVIHGGGPTIEMRTMVGQIAVRKAQ